MSKKIFVSITAYRGDVFTVEQTINNLIKNAKNPENLRFGVCLQNDVFPDLKSKFKNNVVDVIHVELDQVFGVTRARSILKDMCTEEDYFLQIDSHADAIKNWDFHVIEDYEMVVSKTHEKIILSSKHMMRNNMYGREIPYQYEDSKDVPVWFNNFKWTDGIPGIDICPFYSNLKDIFDINKINHLLLTNFLSSHFIFSGKHFIDNFRMSTYIVFFGEEPEFALRLFCDGYDIYNYYDRAIIIHDSERSFHHINYNEIVNIKKENYVKRYKSYNDQKEVADLFRHSKNKFVDLTNKTRSVKDFFDFHLVPNGRRPENLPEYFTDPWDENKFEDKPGHSGYEKDFFTKQFEERKNFKI